jgi:hypothetical protein
LRVFRSKKRLSVAIVGVAGIATFAAVALASPGTIGFVPTTLVTGNLPNKVEHNTDQVKLQTRGATDVRVQRIDIAPGNNSGWHHHPGVVIVTVASGAVQFTHGCTTTTYGPGQPAGSVFVESGNTPARASSVDGAVNYVTFIAPHASPPVFRIEDAGPPTCPSGGDNGDNGDDSGDNHNRR